MKVVVCVLNPWLFHLGLYDLLILSLISRCSWPGCTIISGSCVAFMGLSLQLPNPFNFVGKYYGMTAIIHYCYIVFLCCFSYYQFARILDFKHEHWVKLLKGHPELVYHLFMSLPFFETDLMFVHCILKPATLNMQNTHYIHEVIVIGL